MLNPVELLPVHPSKRHPLTGAPLRALWVRPDGRAMWPIMGADEPSADDKAKAEADAKAKADADAKAKADEDAKKKKDAEEHGFPADTPVKDMTAEERANYYKFQNRRQERRNEEWASIAGGKTPAEVKKMLEDAEAARIAGLSEADKKIEEAKKTGRTEAEQELLPGLVEMAFETALSHVEDDAQRAAMIDALDWKKFVGDNGRVDLTKVKATVAVIAPAGDTPKGRKSFDVGGGKRTPGEKTFGSAGAAEAQRRAERRKAREDRRLKK